MNDIFKFRVYIKYAKMMCYDVNGFYIDRIKNKITIRFDNHTKTFEFDDVVLEQSTGLKDKNGKLIYEGDICIPAEDMADKAGEVYRTGSGAYNIKGKMKSGMEYDFGIYWHHFMYEIIGNIHENSDLLGE